MSHFVVVFLLFLFGVVSGQNIINGKVVSASGVSIIDASITIEEPDTNMILAYGISDAKGYFKISFKTNLPSVSLKIKAYNHR